MEPAAAILFTYWAATGQPSTLWLPYIAESLSLLRVFEQGVTKVLLNCPSGGTLPGQLNQQEAIVTMVQASLANW